MVFHLLPFTLYFLPYLLPEITLCQEIWLG